MFGFGFLWSLYPSSYSVCNWVSSLRRSLDWYKRRHTWSKAPVQEVSHDRTIGNDPVARYVCEKPRLRWGPSPLKPKTLTILTKGGSYRQSVHSGTFLMYYLQNPSSTVKLPA